ncbi:MAG: hypothetical protein KKC30_08455 [Proteobacteria bacterium]|nr:hypothetical protein [Pseudomonadota bacterium]MBU4382355.1 hypothetical protein [Pseudomonadota bacterium]MBU4605457.1 hypothetical protein [Pseudomonadota bacterium]MCG2766019.1 hypothetical protein [Desulfarculaceae bacterium]
MAGETCRNHPDRPSVAMCQKYGHGYCLECLETDAHCSDPDIYCKFREQCLVHFHYKEQKREAARGRA